ncbi:NAD(P)H-hydrate dehydratase [Pseudoalteromonas aurantia]|uniref:Bifunctional NAD(P)H-hydrate repair enzyme n=1 Tax=Pseudoalteromonas aurantia TaxID=43654 RepID=A0ABY2W109_9GAMM|nr:NAD(P)H-hydrate dehydratase [Pseudoalteromonas aurantia]TMO63740.1 bifunctional ADP-dependent NAD(P)H-hydrate dehydratase/NAD(P)H-hydrate epimerase [Pseudoalteromonas aurantia]TMO77480.1 bifunctional ADP-dependent NAD(P)H-hydrate dehydratase/NAD(P)H-hydrate epimerase [Pseudoalteromonas aurantia]
MAVKYTANLPQFAYTAQQVRDNEASAAQLAGLNLSQLMICAADALFDLFDHELVNAEHILILAGKGNNAGDAYLLAELLHRAGRKVTIVAVFSPSLLADDALRAYQRVYAAGLNVLSELPKQHSFDVIVEGVFGIGFSGELSGSLKNIFAYCNKNTALRLSIDVPSGIEASTGSVADGAFLADITLTFIALKQGMLTGSAKHVCGKLLFAPLGVAEAFSKIVNSAVSYVSHSAFMAMRLRRAHDCYKNQCGHVLLVGGNKGMAGAIRLASEACLRSGAGLVSVLTHTDNVAMVQQGRYELMVHGVETVESSCKYIGALFAKADVLVIGPGLGQDSWAKALFDKSFNFDGIVVCDADALNLLALSSLRYKQAVMTPHMGEARRLLTKSNTVDMSNRFDVAAHLQRDYDTTVVVKGPGSLVCQQTRMNINRSGSSAMASAGMGDVLSGIIASLIAQGMEKFAATSLAVYIHGLAAERAAVEGEKGLLAGDLFNHIRDLLG